MTMYVPKTHRGAYGLLVAWTLGILLLVGIVGGILTATGTLFAGASGQAGAYRIKESAVNRIQQQAQFENLKATYDGYLAQLPTLRAAAKSGTDFRQDEPERNDLAVRHGDRAVRRAWSHVCRP